MLWIIGTVWLVVVGGVMMDESVRLELWLEKLARSLGQAAATVGTWMR